MNDSKTYLTNAFSLNMLSIPDGGAIKLRVRHLDLKDAARTVQYEKKIGRLVSAVGHADTARILSDMLGTYVPPNRATVKLDRYDEVLVAQYYGPRLPEGATELPPGAEIKFFLVQIWE